MSETPAPAWDLFVSYADADRGWVEGFLLDGLGTAGVRCLTDAIERSEEHTSELQSHSDLVCRLLLEKKKKKGPHYDGRTDHFITAVTQLCTISHDLAIRIMMCSHNESPANSICCW